MPVAQTLESETADKSHQIAWRLLLTVHAHSCRKIDAELQVAGALSFDDYDVLLTLNEAPNQSLRISELAGAVLLSNSGMSRRVTQLVASRLVTRSQSKSDGRVFVVKLTAKGRKALGTSWEIYRPMIHETFARHLTEKEAATMARLLQKILTDSGVAAYKDLLKDGMTDAPKD